MHPLLKRLIHPTDNAFWQLVRYGISGSVSTIVDMALLWLMTSVWGWYYLPCVVVSYLVGLAITFTLSTFWIFTEHRLGNRWAELVCYALIGGLGMASSALMMWLQVDVIELIQYLPLPLETAVMACKTITVAIVALQNFVLRKFILFSKI